MIFNDITNIRVPEGVVEKITTLDGKVLWIKKGGGDIVIPNNEIWYTSTNRNILSLSTVYNGVQPISNTYKNGIGKMVFENDLTEIGQEMFDSCHTLSEITIPNSVTSIKKWAFYECKRLTKITLPNSITNIENTIFYGCTSLTSITIPNSVTSLGGSIFYRCTSLTDVILSNSITTLQSSIFYECTSLNSITIPESVTSLQNEVFQKCSSLNEIRSLNSIAPRLYYDVFDGLPEVGTLYINEGATGYDVWLENLPEGWSIQYIVPDTPDTPDIPDLPIPLANEIYYTSTDGIIIPPQNRPSTILSNTYENGIGKMIFENDILTIPKWMFENKTTLQKIIIPESVTKIEMGAFNKCYNLQYIYIPQTVNVIESGVFNQCYALEEINIPQSITDLSNHLFNECYALEEITIPQNVTNIENYVFYNCTSLQVITSLNSIAARIQSNSFSNVGTAVTGSKVLRIPKGATGYETWLEKLPKFTIQYIE